MVNTALFRPEVINNDQAWPVGFHGEIFASLPGIEFTWRKSRFTWLSTSNKVLLCKAIINPICAAISTFGDLHGTPTREATDDKVRTIVSATWYVPNDLICNDSGLPPVKDRNPSKRLTDHPNRAASAILSEARTHQRLKLCSPLNSLPAFPPSSDPGSWEPRTG